MKAVVLGHGCISGAGIGPEALAALASRHGARHVAGLDAAVEDLGLRGTRPIARATRLACVAAAAALEGPSPLAAPPERRAVVLGTRFASITSLVEFDRSAALDGPALVNPSAFPNVVANAHAGYLAIFFRLAGPNVTLCGSEAGLEALTCALDLLELGRADVVLAGGVESLGETITEGLRRTGSVEPGEGAAFLLLSRSGTGPRMERTRQPGQGRASWTAAGLTPAIGDCGAAGGVLATVLALHAAEETGEPQMVSGSRDALIMRPE